MKKVISFVLILCLVFSCFSVAAFAESRALQTTSYVIDNDTIDSTCSNIREGYTAYVKDSDYYNGDLRRTYSYSSTDSYTWLKNSSFSNLIQYKPINLTIGVYLKSSVLSDTAASYWCVQNGEAYSAYRMFYMNQTTNANGWSYHSYTLKTNYTTPGWYNILGVEVMPSRTGSGYSAADAISVYASTTR